MTNKTLFNPTNIPIVTETINYDIVTKIYTKYSNLFEKFNPCSPDGNVRNLETRLVMFLIGKTGELYLKHWLKTNIPNSQIKINIMDANTNYEIADGMIDNFTYELRTSFIKNEHYLQNWTTLNHIGPYSTIYKPIETSKDFYFQMLWSNTKAEAIAIVLDFLKHKNKEAILNLNFVSFASLHDFDQIGKISNLGQKDAQYNIIELTKTKKPNDFLQYFDTLKKQKAQI